MDGPERRITMLEEIKPDAKTIPTNAMPPKPEPEPEPTPEPEPEPTVSVEALQSELAKAQKELADAQQHIGAQSNEVGETRRQIAFLTDQITNLQKAEPAQPETDYEAKITEIGRQLEEGGITSQEALVQTARLTREQTLNAASQEFGKVLTERDTKSIQDQFLKDNPEFTQVLQSGELNAIKAENPLHDDLSAYYVFKGRQEIAAKEQEKAELEARIEEAKKAGAEEQAALDKGKSIAGGKGVLASSGASLQHQTTNHKGPATLQTGLDALAKVRAEQSA